MKHVALLGWKDIQSILSICSTAFPRELPNLSLLESKRRSLIDSFLPYLMEWSPGKDIRDQARFDLISALEEFCPALAEGEATAATPEVRESFRKKQEECVRLRNLLREAMGLDESKTTQSGESDFKGLFYFIPLSLAIQEFPFSLLPYVA